MQALFRDLRAGRLAVVILPLAVLSMGVECNRTPPPLLPRW